MPLPPCRALDMLHMPIQPECRPCLARLIHLTVELATDAPALQDQAREHALAVLAAEFSPAAISAGIANKFHQAIKTITGNPDPFAGRKQTETALARTIAAQIPPPRDAKADALLAYAAAGNALDFFRSAADTARNMLLPAHFLPAQLRLWRQRLAAGPGLLLYLADNAGEQYFDLPLVRFLRQQGWQVLYVVKGGPIQNDLSRQDLEDSGLAAALDPVVDTGALTVGLELDQASPAFRDLYAQADLIMAKGMGHFETMAHLADPRLFFLLQAKCPPVAAALDATLGDFVLRHACS